MHARALWNLLCGVRKESPPNEIIIRNSFFSGDSKIVGIKPRNSPSGTSFQNKRLCYGVLLLYNICMILNSFITRSEKIYCHFMKNKILFYPDHWEQLVNPLSLKTTADELSSMWGLGWPTLPPLQEECKNSFVSSPHCALQRICMVSLRKQWAKNSLLLYRRQYMKAVNAGGYDLLCCVKYLGVIKISGYLLKLIAKLNAILYTCCHLSFIPSNHNKHNPIFCHWS